MFDFAPTERTLTEMIDRSKTGKCVIYARCSTNYQEDSVESQIAFNKAFATKNGLEVVGIYKDEGKTGRKDNRDGLQALMKDLDNPDRNWDLVLVYKIDRFFRNARCFMEYQYRMIDHDVYLLTAQESMLNNVQRITNILRFFMATLAELESERIGENVARGKMTAAQKGKWQGGRSPLGYDVVDGTLMINPQEKRIVEIIFEKRAQGVSMQKIADMLNEQGYKSKLDRLFKTTGIREILTNPCYKGTIHYNRSSSRGANGFNRHLYKDDEFVVKNDCPAIISEEVWQSVQPKSENKKRTSKSTRYLLSGKVVCKQCGAVMHSNPRNNHKKLYISFYCPNNKEHKTCATKEIDMFRLENFVLQSLCNELFSKEFIQKFSEEFSSLNKKKKSELSELKVKCDRIDKRCMKLMERLEDDCSDETEKVISKRLDDLAKEKAKFEKAISDLSDTMTYVPSEEDIERARSLFLSYCGEEENRQFVESLIRSNVERVEVDNDSATVFLIY